jgi:hypothetical protein
MKWIRERRTRALALILAIFVLCPVRSLGDQNLTASCSPLVFEPPLNQGTFEDGDRLFKRGDYRKAALAYYQMFFCGQGTEINPIVSERDDFLPKFREAVGLAVSGDFSTAAVRLRRIKMEFDQFTEAGYLAGIFAWAAGDRSSARRSWEQTVHGGRIPMPEETASLAQVAAQQMLAWSRNK